MQPSISETYKLGKDYIQVWPKRPELANYFPQYNAVLASRFVLKHAYPLALVALLLPLLYLGPEHLRMALVYAIVIASMPVQAIFFMAKQAKELLPPSLASWYREGVEKLRKELNQNGLDDVKFTQQKPTYYDLAKLLNYSYNQK